MTDTTCIWTSPNECAMVRERAVAGTDQPIQPCLDHDLNIRECEMPGCPVADSPARMLRLLDGPWRCPLHAPRDPLADLLLSVALASYSGLRNTLLDANAKTLDTIDSQLGKDEEGLPPTLRR